MNDFLVDADKKDGKKVDNLDTNAKGVAVGTWDKSIFGDIRFKLIDSESNPGHVMLQGILVRDYGMKITRRDGETLQCNRQAWFINITAKKDGTLHVYERESERYHPEMDLARCYIRFFEKHAVLKNENGVFKVDSSFRNPETDIHELKNILRSAFRRPQEKQKLSKGDVKYYEEGTNLLFVNKEVRDWFEKESGQKMKGKEAAIKSMADAIEKK
jgi:hypothetical protein